MDLDPPTAATARDVPIAELIDTHLELASSLAHRFRRRGQPFDDLEQTAREGLVKAARRFDPGRGVPFGAYATAVVVGELQRLHRDHTFRPHLPRSLYEFAGAVEQEVDRLTADLRRSPTVDELARSLDRSADDVQLALQASRHRFATLDDDDVVDHDTPAADAADPWLELHPSLEELDARDRSILEMRFVTGLTQREIAARLDISQMHVSRLLRRALERLRMALATG